MSRAAFINDRHRGRLHGETAWFAINAVAMLAVAVFFRLWQLDRVPGVNGDEAWYGVQVMKFVRGESFLWRTPTGNPLNPFYVLPLLGLHLLFSPSFLLLRLPAAASGLLALLVNFVLCRKTCGRTMAWLTTLLLAVLPINIAYSRFGWDASQTLLATLPVCYCAMLAVREPHRGSWWLGWTAAALICAIVVHPTNIFLTPLPLCAFVAVNRERLMAWWNSQSASHATRDRMAAPILQRTMKAFGRRPLTAFAAILGLAAFGWLARHWLVVAGARLFAFDQYGQFLANLPRLFNGITAYRFIAGSKMPASQFDFDPLDGLAWCLAIVAMLGFLDMRRRGLQPMALCLFGGWSLTFLGFFLIAGPQAIAPHYERYGLVLVAPTVILVCFGLAAWLSRQDVLRRVAMNALLAAAWVLVLGIGNQYFGFIHATGGASHATFRTGAVEPKQATFDEFNALRDPRQLAWLAVDDYWNLHPLAYLASGRKNVQVATLSDARQLPEFATACGEGRVWLAGFADSTWWDQEAASFCVRRTQTPFQAPDCAGRPVVRMEHARP